MRIVGMNENDIVNGDEGVCVSLWVQGCPHRCKNCQNPETWDFEKGKEIPKEEVLSSILKAIPRNGVKRNFSVLGGEPLCEENIEDTLYIVSNVRKSFPNIRIMLWSGYYLPEISGLSKGKEVLRLIDVLIDGRYDETLRDTRLVLRGSSNQRVLLKGEDF